MINIKGLSLFSNIGVAEAYLKELGVDVVIANELLEDRARLYQEIYPDTEMVCGDITDSSTYSYIIKRAKEEKIDFIMATPPCQGMSTAGKQQKDDPRNFLVTYALDAILALKPKFVMLENVPQQLKTKIHIDGKSILIPEYIKSILEPYYKINSDIVNAVEYGVPQMRQRSIYLMVRKDLDFTWDFISDDQKTCVITLEDAIGDLPSLDPKIQGYSEKQQLELFPEYYLKRDKGEAVSKWHYPPTHKIRHVEAMMYTAEGCSALNNPIHYPKKPDGTKVRGYSNTYKRQSWNKPGYTITTYNGAICSHDNVHPGRYIGLNKNGEAMYSDARVLSIYELMIVMSLPKNWPIPDWASDSLIRHTIGEGIPSLIVKKLFMNLLGELSSNEKKD